MPEFLNLLFPLGERVLAQDFYTDGFYQRTYLSSTTQGLQAPERAWSGHYLKICYSLKSVERSESQTDWPWSIRHCAIHHSFDVENVRSSWVIVKGNKLIVERIQKATSGRGPPEFSSYGSIDRAFAAALATHLLLVDWSAENWRWYINFLENKVEESTQGAISNDADVPVNAMDSEDVVSLVARTGTQSTNSSPKAQRFSHMPFHTRRLTSGTASISTEMQPLQTQKTYTNPRSGKKQPLPPGRSIMTNEASNKPVFQYDLYGQRQFKFRDLQDIQDLEESANETVLVLRLNLNICRQIFSTYQSLFHTRELPEETIRQKCQVDMNNFERKIQGAESQMNSQILRVEALLRLMAGRRALVNPPLQAYLWFQTPAYTNRVS